MPSTTEGDAASCMPGSSVQRDPVQSDCAAAAHEPVFAATVAAGADALLPFEDFHRSHQWHPESHLDLLRAQQARGHAATPLLLMVARDGVPCTLVVGQVVDTVVPWRVGYGTLGSSRARVLEILRGGILGEQSAASLEFACDQLRAILREQRIDAIAVRHAAQGSPAHAVFARRPAWLCRDRLATVTQNWQMTVPVDFAAFLAAQPKREREDNRRYERRIRQQFGETVRFERLEDPAEVDRFAAAVESIACKTYQRGLGAGFQDTVHERARWRTAAENGFLHVQVLWLGEQPVAFSVGFEVGTTLWLEHLGFDPEHRRLRPGFFQLLRVVEDLAAERRLLAIDFGIGDADYKRRLCDRQRNEVTVWVFAPTVKGLWLNGVRASTHGLFLLGRWTLDRVGLLDWLKRRWRRALQPPAESAAES